MKFLPAIALALSTWVGGSIALGYAAPAEAADGDGKCPNAKLIEAVNIKAGSTVIGQLRLNYIASARDACAVTFHSGPTKDVVASTGVLIARSTPPSGGYTQAAYQRGNYRNQAGPIRADVTGRCYYAGGGVTYRGKHYTVYTGVHCS